MFLYEIDKASVLLEKYKRSIVREDIYFGEWMNGKYKCLVPKILAQVISAARFMKYMYYAIENDGYPNDIRVRGREALYDPSVINNAQAVEYEGVFDEITSSIALQLIEQKNGIAIYRYELCEGIWTAENYYELAALNRVMDTMCLLCEKVFGVYYEKIGPYEDAQRASEEELVCCPWETEEDRFAGDDIEDIYPPLWVKTYCQ